MVAHLGVAVARDIGLYARVQQARMARVQASNMHRAQAFVFLAM